jgi:mannose-6-phosphate isomerase-like protein (cupin superfamily)
VGSESYQIESGDVALVPKEEEHGHRNTGKEDLLLLVVNFPATR